jgi:excisionase family DNA binding protein
MASNVETPAVGLADVRFLTVAEAAPILRVSRRTVYRLVHSGELEAVRVGRSFRIREDVMIAYLRNTFISS